MTTQIGDRITLDGGPLLPLYNEPLTPWLEAAGWELVSYCSACWRGHVATWAVRDERLWLVDLDEDPFSPVGCRKRRKQRRNPASRGPTARVGGEERKITLADLFPGERPPILASWVSGALRVSVGAALRVDPLDGPLHEEDIWLWVEEGRVLWRLVEDNRAPEP